MKGSRSDRVSSRGSGREKSDRLRGSLGMRREQVAARRAVDSSQYRGRREAHLRGTPRKADILPAHRMRNVPADTTRVDDGAGIMHSKTAQTSVSEIFNTR